MGNFAIAIDGPAGSGKSTVAKIVAKELDIIYVDTGAMYRAVGLYCLRNGIDTKNQQAVSNVLDKINLLIKSEKGIQHIFLDQKDVTDDIRTPEAGQAASDVAQIIDVRKKLVEIQREIAEKNNVIMDGRDIGTNVLPNAEIKIYLDASPDIRAKRRCGELEQKGIAFNFEDIKQQIISRDYNDINRKYNPLQVAEDAIKIDSSDMTIEQVCEIIIALANGLEWRII